MSIDLEGRLRRLAATATAQAAIWTAALATALANYTATRAGYLDELDFDLEAAIAAVQAEVDNLDGDAMRGTDDATLQATWTDAMAGYQDELAAANLPSDIDDTLYNTAVIHHQSDSRSRVYPQVPSSVISLTTAAVADTFGNWTQAVPIDTIDMLYKVIAVMIEQAGAAATFIVQFGYSTVDGDDPTTAQIVGEQRFKVIGTPLKTYHSDLRILGSKCPVNAKLWARLSSGTGNADTADISIVVTRHIEVTNEIASLATWPWAS